MVYTGSIVLNTILRRNLLIINFMYCVIYLHLYNHAQHTVMYIHCMTLLLTPYSVQGAAFSHICKMTDVFEGSIIRCMRRLEELLRQMCQAAKAIGNTELENKFAGGKSVIIRTWY